MKYPCVYILASSKNGSLYIGVTSDLPSRLEDHELGIGSKHAAKYQIRRLVWFEDLAVKVLGTSPRMTDLEACSVLSAQRILKILFR